MKKSIFLFLVAVICFACEPKEDYTTYSVTAQLVYPESSEIDAIEGVTIVLTSNSGTIYEAQTDSTGSAIFSIPEGIYNATSSEKRSYKGKLYILNGNETGVVINETWNEEDVIEIALLESQTSQIIIKELYNGGCTQNDGNSTYQYDKYVILYNNSTESATIPNLCFGMIYPSNGHANNPDLVNGTLSYAAEGFLPAWNGIWYYDGDITMAAGEQIVVAINGAIDHTVTYTNSVDLSNADYIMYDTDVYPNTSYYPSPSASIPTSNYMSAYMYALGNGWPLSVSSPALVVFSADNPYNFATNADNYYNPGGSTSQALLCSKVPNSWVIDGLEVFSNSNIDKSNKRLTNDIDAGYVGLTQYQGHSLYRNVDKEATEAISSNAGKLVYNYTYGTDPSEIDAEASLANGALIIYQDTNNSTNDFHERSRSSLKN